MLCSIDRLIAEEAFQNGSNLMGERKPPLQEVKAAESIVV